MASITFLVTQHGCQVDIKERAAAASLVPVESQGNQIVKHGKAIVLQPGAHHDVPAGIYHVAGSSAFTPIGDGVIIVYDAEDPPVPVPNALLRFTRQEIDQYISHLPNPTVHLR